MRLVSLMLSLCALALLALAALVVIPANPPCEDGQCLAYLPLQALAILLGVIGFVLTFSATTLSVVRTVERRQWGWCVGLVVGVLAPLPAGLILSFPNRFGGGDKLLQLLPTCVGLVLTPVVALIYSLRYLRGAAAERSSFPVPLPAAEPLGEPAPPPLDAP